MSRIPKAAGKAPLANSTMVAASSRNSFGQYSNISRISAIPSTSKPKRDKAAIFLPASTNIAMCPRAIPSTSKAIPSTSRVIPLTSKSIPSTSKNVRVPPKDSTIQSRNQEPVSIKLPPFGSYRPLKDDTEKIKRTTMRRNKPEGEDLPKLIQILKGLQGKNINVAEFIGLVGPSTGDNGSMLRNVLAEELSSFQNTTRKIYETMTQDIGDVLTNENIQLNEDCKEMHLLYTDKLERCLNEIYELAPNFDFDAYQNNENYLTDLFPLAPEKITEESEAINRQEAYHRYEWLKCESERLRAENTMLQAKLNQLKKTQRIELEEITKRQRKLEEERENLEQKQDNLEEKLEELNNTVEKNIVQSERILSEKSLHVHRLPQELQPSTSKQASTQESFENTWAEQTAKRIENKRIAQKLNHDIKTAKVRSKSSLMKMKVKKTKTPAPKLSEGETSPFHYSPPTSPRNNSPSRGERETSPFHYSPLKEQIHFEEPFSLQREVIQPQRQQSGFHHSPTRDRSAFHYSPQKTPPGGTRTEPYEKASREVEAQPQIRYGRRNMAPRDTWKGFQG